MANTLLTIPAGSFPQFDELYVISDLHLGGPANFQIFNSGEELKNLIEHLTARLPNKKIALVINGDFVDFLAEEPAKHFDPEGAVGKLNRIAKDDPSFNLVFDALKGFTNKKNRRLVINLGNHDLELALPWVKAELLEILSDGSDEACGRITFAFDGAGFPCRVGNATVLCVHGNEVDAWNLADYETIRRFGREVLHGRPIDSWVPNAGSQLVIDVMNDLKRRFPFVDLLKPETKAAIPTLLALAPDQRDKLLSFSATVSRLVADKFRQMFGFLGSNGKQDGDLRGRTIAAADILSSDSDILLGGGTSALKSNEYAKMLLDETEERFEANINPMALLGENQIGSQLGVFSSAFSFFRGGDVSEALRQALIDLPNKDESFNPEAGDKTFELLDAQIGEGFDFLIAGHTHLARALEREKQKGWYFNSGTWARLIKLEEKVLNSTEEFKKVFETFKQGTMKALDSAPELVIRKLSVVVIRADGKQTHGELRQVNLLPASDVFMPVNPNHSFTKK